MKRKAYSVIWLAVCCLQLTVSGQLNDAQWMLGPNTSNIDFRGAAPVSDSIQKGMATFRANTAISNTQGNMLYYTNGIWISGKLSDGDTITNGMGLNPCPLTTQYSGQGLPDPQCLLFLNKPGDTQNRYYYLIHFTGDNGGVCYTLYYSIIDAQGNFGMGEVISKNDTFYQGITRTGGMAACKHANGRDWWIIIPGRNNNLYRKFLLTSDDIKDTLTQNIGPNYMGPLDQSSGKFSLDGTKYAISSWSGLITVMDFDRCTGELSNPRTIDNAEPGVGKGALIEFSPNGRFIYATNTAKLEQYDLDNSNIQDSVVLYRQTSAQYASTNQLSLALDGRLYASTWAAGYYFISVINFPDELGLNCNFVYGGQPSISSYTWNVSNTANPRLGPLVGSGCDTITTEIRGQTSENRQQPRVFPNPADKAFYIEMPAQGNYVFELLNEAGQVVERRETKQVDIINVQGLPSGQYFLSVKEKSGKVLSTQTAVVLHP